MTRISDKTWFLFVQAHWSYEERDQLKHLVQMILTQRRRGPHRGCA